MYKIIKYSFLREYYNFIFKRRETFRNKTEYDKEKFSVDGF